MLETPSVLLSIYIVIHLYTIHIVHLDIDIILWMTWLDKYNSYSLNIVFLHWMEPHIHRQVSQKL